MLTRLIYHSENHAGGAGGKMIRELNDILAASERNNKRDGITGALLFDTLWFVQILEGERAAVSAALRRIMRDARHDEVTVMDARPAESRMFANWWMGLALLRGEHKDVLARHGLASLDPRTMSGEQALALAAELAQSGLSRQIASSAA